MFTIDADNDGQLDHPFLYYMWFVLVGINILDVLSTRYALLNPDNMEGNPLMAPLLPYAVYIKIFYIMFALVLCDWLEHRNGHKYGVIIMSMICIISFIIVGNNLLVLNGIYLF